MNNYIFSKLVFVLFSHTVSIVLMLFHAFPHTGSSLSFCSNLSCGMRRRRLEIDKKIKLQALEIDQKPPRILVEHSSRETPYLSLLGPVDGEAS